MTGRRAVFLDRDNTLIDNDGDLGDPERVRLLAGVGDALRKLREAGFLLVVVSNQGGVARGAFSETDVEAVNARITGLLGPGVIERFYWCPYHPDGSVEPYRREHSWRKPQPGMLVAAQRDLDLDLGRSWMIGDKPRDVEAGRAAGCRTVLVAGEAMEDTGATAVVRTIAEAAEVVLKATAETRRRGGC